MSVIKRSEIRKYWKVFRYSIYIIAVLSLWIGIKKEKHERKIADGIEELSKQYSQTERTKRGTDQRDIVKNIEGMFGKYLHWEFPYATLGCACVMS